MRLRYAILLCSLLLGSLACLSNLSAHIRTTGDAPQHAAQLLALVDSPTVIELHQLITALADESDLVRQAAAGSLAQLGEAATPAVKPLTQSLSDRDARVRWAAATALQRIGKPASPAEAALIRATRDRDADVQCSALAALRSIDVEDIASLSVALSDCLAQGLTDVQFESLTTMSFIVPHLDESLRNRMALAVAQALTTPHEDVRLAAATLLGDLGVSSATAVPYLVRGVHDSDSAVRAASLRSLNHFAADVCEQWNHLSPERRDTLRRPCRVVVQSLSIGDSTFPNSDEVNHVLARFQELLDDIQLASGERPSAAQRVETTPSSLPALDMNKPTTVPIPPSVVASALSIDVQPWFMGALVGITILYWLKRWISDRESLPALATPTVVDHQIEMRANAKVSGTALAAGRVEIPAASAVPLTTASTPHANINLTTNKHHIQMDRAVTDSSAEDSDIYQCANDSCVPYLEALKDPKADIRHSAVVALGKIGLGAIDAVPKLVVALSDCEPRIRAAAAFALSAFGPHAMESVPELKAALSDDASQVRASAAFALGQIGPAARRAIPELSQCLGDATVAVRRQAASVLGGFGSDAATSVNSLIEAAQDVDVKLRRNAIISLGLIDAASAEPVLRRALSDGDSIVRSSAQSALAGLSHSHHEHAGNSNNPGSTTLKVFQPSDSESQTTSAEDFLSALENTDSDVRWNAVQSLIQLGKSAVPEIRTGLRHRNPEVRRLLIGALSRIGSAARQAIPDLLMAMRDEQAEVRAAATEALGRLGVVSRPMLQSLIQTLSDANAEVRRYSATTLGRFGEHAREATVALQIASLTDVAGKVRSAAQAALQRITESMARAA